MDFQLSQWYLKQGVKGSFVLRLCFSDHQTRRDWLSFWCKLEYLKAVVTNTWPNPNWKQGTPVAGDSWNVTSSTVHPLATFPHWGKAYALLGCVGVLDNRNLNHQCAAMLAQGRIWLELTEIAWCFLSEKKRSCCLKTRSYLFWALGRCCFGRQNHKCHSVCLN